MRRQFRRAAGLVCFGAGMIMLAALPASAATDIVLDIRPGAILIGGGGDFKATGVESIQGVSFTEVEKLGGISTFPNLKVGLGWENPDSYIDATLGGGILVNDPFRSIYVGADAAWQYKYRKNVAVGPHLGLMKFMNPDWSGDADIELSDSWGALLGMQMTLGYDILFIFSIDYFYTNPFDVTESGGWVASDSELDLSGIALQFGMRGRF